MLTCKRRCSCDSALHFVGRLTGPHVNANHLADQANPLVNPVHLNSQQVSEHEGILTMLVGFLALANGNHLTCSGLVYDSEDTPSL